MSRRARILIVDDEPTNVRVLAETLQDQHALSVARSGRDALELAARISVDLILLDVVMPGMDGMTTLKHLRSHPATSDVPVIFVTSMSDLDDEARGLELGAVDYITKPVNPSIVRARVSTHLELKRQRDLLNNLANLDGLTGIANRRRFDHEFDQRWAIQQSTGGGLGLAIIDIDHFKQFNDHYGHALGDECLRRVGQALEAMVSAQGAMVARYGGEEFAILSDPGLLSRLAKESCEAVRDLSIPHVRSTANAVVTVSVGGATLDDCRDSARAALFRAADRRLYLAKRDGRNRAVVGDHLDENNGGGAQP